MLQMGHLFDFLDFKRKLHFIVKCSYCNINLLIRSIDVACSMYHVGRN